MEKQNKSSVKSEGAILATDGQGAGTAFEVFAPTGALELTNLHAPRLAGLNGKTICELGNAKWEDHRIFPVIRELLKKRFPDVKIIPFKEFPHGYLIDDDQVAAMIREKGGQGVILASAA